MSFGIFLLSCPLFAQNALVNISGTFKNQGTSDNLPFVNVVLIKAEDSTFVSGTITNDLGLFTLTSISPGDYLLETTSIGFEPYSKPLYLGFNSKFINLSTILLAENILELEEVVVTGQQETLSTKMDKKTFNLENNLSQSGGSALQAMSNLPGVSIQEGQVMLRGNHQVVILINGQQTAMTGFGNQNGLDNLPASSIQKIEIINNPSLSANYRKKNNNLFIQADHLYTETLNKNEFVTRTYQNRTQIIQQLKRNRDTHYWTSNAGMDWFLNDHNPLTISGLFTQESIKDYGDQPFFNSLATDQIKLWQFLEDEVLTAAMGSITYQHSYRQPGHQLTAGIHYTFDREDEKYFFTNTLPLYTTKESFFSNCRSKSYRQKP